MAYTKINWTEEIEITAARLNHMETQYDEAVDAGDDIRKDQTSEFRAEVVSSLSGQTPSQGRIVYNQGTNRFHYGTGTAWRMAFGRHIFVQSSQPTAALEGDIWIEEF